MLDQRFFERINTTNHGGSVLESYKAVYARSTMVLFSRKTRTPLAALTLKTSDVGCLSMLTGRPAPEGASESYFQGMLNMPDEIFTFTISNLSEKGMINFNVLHTPHRVSQVDPGPSYGINEVNELHQNQSYTIEADQRNNRRMILKGKTITVKDHETSEEKQVALTVKESEANKNFKGLYFYLSVVPDAACRSLVDKFSEGTVWRVTPGIVRQVSRPAPPPPRYMVPPPQSQMTFWRMAPPMASSQITEMASCGAMAPTAGALFGRGHARQRLDGSAAQRSSGSRRALTNAATSLRRLVQGRPDGAFMSLDAASPAPQAASFNVNAQLEEHAHDLIDLDEIGDKRGALKSSATAAPVDVGHTQAGELTYGQHVDVHSSYTRHDYAYQHASEPTVLCMSIWEEMKFLSLSNLVEEQLEAEVKEMIENKGRALIESLNAIYKSETCTIDLESEADTIVCTCGHQCLNHSNVGNLRKCPLCRLPITAFVRADGIMIE